MPATLAGEILALGVLGDPALLKKFAKWGLPSTGAAAGLLAAKITYWHYELREWLGE